MSNGIRFILNDEPISMDVRAHWTMLRVIRDILGVKGTKSGCDEGDCGSCNVLLDGKVVPSCLILAVDANGKAVTTIEGLSGGKELHPLQKAFIEVGAVQCGFCTPGMILSAKALLDQNPYPSEGQIREAITGNICRCTGYEKIVQAIRSAAEMIVIEA
jgi:carbon-monoxide dehydrogenase small subunit